LNDTNNYSKVKGMMTRLEDAIKRGASVYIIESLDDALSYCSIGSPVYDNFQRENPPSFTKEESAAIFAAARESLSSRLSAIKEALRAELG
jgi:hypothetical protein